MTSPDSVLQAICGSTPSTLLTAVLIHPFIIAASLPTKTMVSRATILPNGKNEANRVVNFCRFNALDRKSDRPLAKAYSLADR